MGIWGKSRTNAQSTRRGAHIAALAGSVLLAATMTPTASSATAADGLEIVGVAQVGNTLRVVSNRSCPGPQYAAWYRNGSSIGIGGTYDWTYTLVTADANQMISASVICQTGDRDSTVLWGDTTGPVLVAPAAFTVTQSPSISGLAKVGNTLTIDAGSVSPEPESTTLQWWRDGTAIPGETGSAYTLTTGDVGKSISATITRFQWGYDQLVQTLSPPNVVAGGTLQTTAAPSISGTPRVGGTLTAEIGTTSPAAASTSFQWRVGGSGIPGATGPTLVLQTHHLGQRLSVTVTRATQGYDSLVETLLMPDAIAPGTFQAVDVPAVSGTPRVGSTLTVSGGTTAPAAAFTSIQWARDGVPIQNGPTTAYTPTVQDVGKSLSVTVVAAGQAYDSLSRTVPVGVVLPGTFATIKKASASGRAKVGQRLAARAATLRPTASKVTFQWLRDNRAIKGAKRANYKATASDVGHRLRVRISYSRTGYANVIETLVVAKRIVAS